MWRIAVSIMTEVLNMKLVMLIGTIELCGCLGPASDNCVGGGLCPPGQRCGLVGDVQVCAAETCGNGHPDPGEACDDGNNVSGDGCPADCGAPCGDGILDPGEVCDSSPDVRP